MQPTHLQHLVLKYRDNRACFSVLYLCVSFWRNLKDSEVQQVLIETVEVEKCGKSFKIIQYNNVTIA